MTEDENTGDLANAQIERERRKMWGKGGDGDHYERTDKGPRGFWIPPSVLNTLIVGAIIALAGALWNYKESFAVLRTTQEFQQRQIDKLERRQDNIEGRNLRGGPDAGGPDALNK